MTWSSLLKNGWLVGKGQLQHHFWGEYSASITIWFDSVADARVAKRVLGRGWQVARYKDTKTAAPAVSWHGTSAQLSKVEKVLQKFGADPDKVSSFSKSIDFGEPFVVYIPPLSEGKSYREMEQISLFK